MQLLDRYEEVVGHQEVERLRQLAAQLEGRRIVHVNSRRTGGGVAEILGWMILLMRELGLDARWEMVTGPPDFYRVTKAFHNGLQGLPVMLRPRNFELHYEVNRENAQRTINALQRSAVVVLQKSIKEGFGLTVTEALWKGKPVIGGTCGGITLQVHDYHTGSWFTRRREPRTQSDTCSGTPKNGSAWGTPDRNLCASIFCSRETSATTRPCCCRWINPIYTSYSRGLHCRPSRPSARNAPANRRGNWRRSETAVDPDPPPTSLIA